ncbi:RRM domain (fragment) [Candidatus Methylomirabilis oxygeniifera]|uniref:RRM domain n=1 Tax=Methylomirabilis oxygeniifera TaxID=671143 RepID=D5MJ32_METO1
MAHTPDISFDTQWAKPMRLSCTPLLVRFALTHNGFSGPGANGPIFLRSIPISFTLSLSKRK